MKSEPKNGFDFFLLIYSKSSLKLQLRKFIKYMNKKQTFYATILQKKKKKSLQIRPFYTSH